MAASLLKQALVGPGEALPVITCNTVACNHQTQQLKANYQTQQLKAKHRGSSAQQHSAEQRL